MDSFAEIYGYTFTAYAIAAAFGPLLMGWSFDQFHSYVSAVLALAAAMLVGAFAIGSLPAEAELPGLQLDNADMEQMRQPETAVLHCEGCMTYRL